MHLTPFLRCTLLATLLAFGSGAALASYPRVSSEKVIGSPHQILQAAMAGSPEAQYNLAVMYYNGDGVVRNRYKAAE